MYVCMYGCILYVAVLLFWLGRELAIMLDSGLGCELALNLG